MRKLTVYTLLTALMLSLGSCKFDKRKLFPFLKFDDEDVELESEYYEEAYEVDDAIEADDDDGYVPVPADAEHPDVDDNGTIIEPVDQGTPAATAETNPAPAYEGPSAADMAAAQASDSPEVQALLDQFEKSLAELKQAKARGNSENVVKLCDRIEALSDKIKANAGNASRAQNQKYSLLVDQFADILSK